MSPKYLLLMPLAWILAACPDPGKRPIGEACESNGACASGLCAESVCLDPNADDDGDGLLNDFEARIGSNPFQKDTDADGVADAEELATDRAVTDTDGDGHADVIESKTADKDGDCITDQFDAEDDVPSTDLSPMLPVVCRQAGVCAAPGATLGVACPVDVAICVYTGVPGYADPETHCDRVDENCDGVIDDGFPDVNADHIADACEALHHFEFQTAPTTATVGTPFSVSLVLKDEHDAVVTTFAPGDVTLVMDPVSVGFVAGAATTTAGVVTFAGVTITQPGTGVLVVTTGNFTARSAPIDAKLTGDAAPVFSEAPTTVAAGDPFAVKIEMRMPGGERATAYTGTVTFEAPDDALATLPEPVTFVAGDAGTKLIQGFQLVTAGTQHLRATDKATGTSAEATIEVTPGAETHFEVAGPNGATARVGYMVTVRAVDSRGQLKPDYLGTVAITSTDEAAELPGNVTFKAADQGQLETDAITFHTAGEVTVTVTDVDDATIKGTFTLRVAPGPRATIEAVCAQTASAGTSISCVLTARDADGNIATGYTGTVTVKSTNADWPGTEVTFTPADKGQRTITGIGFVRAGEQGVAFDDGTVQATAALIVTPAAGAVITATSLPSEAEAGAELQTTVTVRDAFGNRATNWNGTLLVSSSDPRATVPAEFVLTAQDAGEKVLGFRFLTAGAAQTVTISRDSFPVATGHVTLTTEVVAGAPETAVWQTALADQQVNVALPAIEVRVADHYGNLIAGTEALNYGLRIGRNPGAARLGGAAAITTAAGVATFEGVTLDDGGDGYTLVAEIEGLGSATSPRFNVTWRPPVVSEVSINAENRGCVPIQYTVAQPDGHPVEVLAEIENGPSRWEPLPQAGSWGNGAVAVESNPDGMGHTFMWDFGRQYHFTDFFVTAGKVRVTARIGRAAGTGYSGGAFSVFGTYQPSGALVPLSLAKPALRMAAGDVNNDGLNEVIIPGEDGRYVVLGSDGLGGIGVDSEQLFVETAFTPNLTDVAIADIGDYSRSIAFLDSANNTVWFARYNGEGGYYYSGEAYPCGGDQIDAMAFGRFYAATESLFATCTGANGSYWALLQRNMDGWFQVYTGGLAGSAHAIALADLARDGQLNPVIGLDAGGVVVLQNTQGELTTWQELVTPKVAQLLVGERGNDTLADLVVRDGDGNVWTYAGTQSGGVFDPNGIGLPALADEAFGQLAPMDVDDDGLEDMVSVRGPAGVAIDRGVFGPLMHGEPWTAYLPVAGTTNRAIVRLPRAGLRDELGVLYENNDGTWSYAVWHQATELCTVSADVALPSSSTTPHWLAAFDGDRDGRTDLVGVHDSDFNVAPYFRVALGRGDGGFEARDVQVALDVPNYGVTALGTSDFDADGVPEVIVATYEGAVEIFQGRNNDGYYFRNATTLNEDYGVNALAVGDFDNDAQEDLVVATGDGSLIVHFPEGFDFYEGGQTVVLPGIGSVSHLAIGDLNVDGLADLAYSIREEGRQEVCTMLSVMGAGGQGARTFADPVCVPTADGVPASPNAYEAIGLAIGHFGTDGRAGLAVGLVGYSSNEDPVPGYVVLRTQGEAEDGVLTATSVTEVCAWIDGLAFGRFDDDRLPDLVTSCPLEGQLQTYRGTGTGFEPIQQVAVGDTYGNPLVTGDFNGDGRDEVAYGAAVYPTYGPSGTLGGPNGTDGLVNTFGVTADYWQDGTPFDFNGDRPTDFAFVGTSVYDTGDGNGCDVSIVIADAYRNHRSYTLQNVIYPSSYNPQVHVAAGDFDGDRRQELALLYGDGPNRVGLRILWRDAFGEFLPDDNYDQLISYGQSPDALATGDLNQDGMDDIVAVGSFTDGSESFQIFQTDPMTGKRDLWRPSNNPDVPTNVRQAAIGHFTGSINRQQVAILGSCGGTDCIRIFEDYGCYSDYTDCYGYSTEINGNFNDGSVRFERFIAADVNADGRTDLVIQSSDATGDATAYTVLVFIQDGRSGFQYYGSLFSNLGTSALPQMAVGDFDADGSLDLVRAQSVGKSRINLDMQLTQWSDWRFASVIAPAPQAIFAVRVNSRLGVLLLEATGTRFISQFAPQ